MSPGKMSAQAGHAFSDTLHQALLIDSRYHEYSTGQRGSKVTLQAKNISQILKYYNQALELGFPSSIVIDKNHVIPNSKFDGEPIITALGIGPITKNEAKFLKSLRCVR